VKKLIFILLIIFAIPSFSQTKSAQYRQQYQAPSYGADYWYSSGNQYGGVPTYGYSSFTWGISKSQFTDSDGYYKFKVWFISTSYTMDYYSRPIWRSTHLWDVKVYADGYLKVSVGSTSFRELWCESQLTFYSKNPTPSISLSANHKML